MEEIKLEDELINKLNGLAQLLFDKEYFSYLENAEDYVLNIKDFIYTIPSLKHKRTKNKKHGAFYCSYKPNRHTTWYITFNTEASHYLIKNITNNHSKNYARFIAAIK